MDTVGDMLKRLRVHLEETAEESWEDVQLLGLLNSGIRRVAAQLLALDEDWYTDDTTLTVAANTELHELPAGFIRIRLLYDENGNPVTKAAINQRLDLIGYGSSRWYYIHKKRASGPGGTPKMQIGILDIPTAAKSWPMKYVYTPTKYATDGSDNGKEPDIPDLICRDLAVTYAAIDAQDMDEEESNVLTKKARMLERQLGQVYYSTSGDFPEQIPGDPDLNDLEL